LFKGQNEPIDGKMFEGLVSLTKLEIQLASGLQALRKDTFLSLPDLEWLTLYQNRPNAIVPGLFNGLSILKRLELAICCCSCPRLVDLPNLEILILSGNQIESTDDLFAGMKTYAVNTKLRVLDLSKNWLTSLKANEFSRLVGLVSLNLQWNRFDIYSTNFPKVEIGAFSGLVNLQELSFSFHGISLKSLDLAAFGNEPDLANLRYLYLDNLNSIGENSIVSSVDPSKLFAHCRHRLDIRASKFFFDKFLYQLVQNSRISLFIFNYVD
jgi:Leucine-rich repeat (LRR) protein